LAIGHNATEINVAKRIAETCISIYQATVTQLPPEYGYFTPDKGLVFEDESTYRLEADFMESLLYLWRVTKIHTFKSAAQHIW
jgi:hypothetical protein